MAAQTYSFDIVSDFDRQELLNAVDQTLREVKSRYDLKDTRSEVRLDEEQIVIDAASELSLEAIFDILRTKAAKRNLSLKIFAPEKIETAAGNRVRQVIRLQRGLNQELAKKIAKLVRDESKTTVQIQGESVRVTSKSRDELQAVIQLLKNQDYPVALQFVNYR
ncbi:YajQ family cyclic di-GMP-binding protein [Gloeobacter kilaueensis]|uniref:Nucleotide-binding protein GKIL_0372 n=1 Tax=Gloeobacter kilaueensis (strain ATCC BAA-2537 / CCAP 1431/1 / ULC 316 / JS1) TaxID=1183438 RepID=U5QG50_GLOK1|nr:YajQ family cyclic di-GMP-binding protein [Gloeobacter kilaueensis]AGY56619.1 nucleotide-binding protein [Gloeobacter kilaueensis JS1]